MYTIHLHNLRFHAHHGIHQEEEIAGASFEVSVDIAFKTEGIIRKLDQTVNYVTVYSIIRDYMKKPEALLETLAENITNTIYASDQRITKINITINKLNPPIANFSGQVGVSFEKSFIE